MTDKQLKIKDRLAQYGHFRRCECYHGMCLVIPNGLLELMVMRIEAMLSKTDNYIEEGVKIDD